jgi:hypothetical protein
VGCSLGFQEAMTTTGEVEEGLRILHNLWDVCKFYVIFDLDVQSKDQTGTWI